MKKQINTEGLLTYAEFAEKRKLFRQRISQLVNENRLKVVVVLGRNYIHEDAVIKSSKNKRGPKPDKSLKVRHNGKLVYKSQIK